MNYKMMWEELKSTTELVFNMINAGESEYMKGRRGAVEQVLDSMFQIGKDHTIISMEKPSFIEIWGVSNGDHDCIIHFQKREKAIDFMMTYGKEGWYCMKRTIFFADEMEPQKAYDNVTIETEGEWTSYTKAGPKVENELCTACKKEPAGPDSKLCRACAISIVKGMMGI